MKIINFVYILNTRKSLNGKTCLDIKLRMMQIISKRSRTAYIYSVKRFNECLNTKCYEYTLEELSIPTKYINHYFPRIK